MAKSKKVVSKSNLTVVGVGAAAFAVAAAGAYWFYGSPEATKNRKIIRSWMLKARGDVLEAVEKVMEKVGEIDKDTYSKIVDDVLKRYSKVAGVTEAEMKQITQDMKLTWQHMQKVRKNFSQPKAKTVTKAKK